MVNYRVVIILWRNVREGAPLRCFPSSPKWGLHFSHHRSDQRRGRDPVEHPWWAISWGVHASKVNNEWNSIFISFNRLQINSRMTVKRLTTILYCSFLIEIAIDIVWLYLKSSNFLTTKRDSSCAKCLFVLFIIGMFFNSMKYSIECYCFDTINPIWYRLLRYIIV